MHLFLFLEPLFHRATPGTTNLRIALRIVPTALCYLACIEAEAGWEDRRAVCTTNVVVWYLTLLGKMPFMNGVRLFGINAHPVIGQEESGLRWPRILSLLTHRYAQED